MDPIVTVRYLDAAYFSAEEDFPKDYSLKIHVALGKLYTFSDYIILSFVEENNKFEKGLLIPIGLLVFETESEKIKNSIDREYLSQFLPNSTVGVFWRDIVFFQNGVIPSEPTKMYTEGVLYNITSTIITIKSPETIKIKDDVKNHHPEENISFCIIPIACITSIEHYNDKKI